MRCHHRLLHQCWRILLLWVLISPYSLGALAALALPASPPDCSILWSLSRSLRSSMQKKNLQRHDKSSHSMLRSHTRVLSVPRGGGETHPQSSSSSSSSWLSVSQVVVNEFWKSHPLVAGGSVCAIKAILADLLAQKVQHASSSMANSNSSGSSSRPHRKFDLRRTFAFTLYGALYQGVIQEFIFNHFYTYLFGTATTALVVAKKVLFNAIFHNALICIPMAYAVKAFVYHYSVRKAIHEYMDDVRYHGLLIKNNIIWIPVNVLVFTIVPPHYRITVVAIVSFFWMFILSSISSCPRST